MWEVWVCGAVVVGVGGWGGVGGGGVEGVLVGWGGGWRGGGGGGGGGGGDYKICFLQEAGGQLLNVNELVSCNPCVLTSSDRTTHASSSETKGKWHGVLGGKR